MVDGHINGSLEIKKKKKNSNGLKNPSNCYLDKNIKIKKKLDRQQKPKKLNQLKKTK